MTAPPRLTPEIIEELAHEVSVLIARHAELIFSSRSQKGLTSIERDTEAVTRGQLNAYGHIAKKFGSDEEIMRRAKQMLADRTNEAAQC